MIGIRQSFRSTFPVTNDTLLFQGAILPSVTAELHALWKVECNQNKGQSINQRDILKKSSETKNRVYVGKHEKVKGAFYQVAILQGNYTFFFNRRKNFYEK